MQPLIQSKVHVHDSWAMSLAVGSFGSSVNLVYLRNGSSIPGRYSWACVSLKPSGDTWRKWVSEEAGSKLSAGFIKFRQPIGSSGFNVQHLQLIKESSLADAEAITCSDEGKSICSDESILQVVWRTLIILGLGLGLTRPAFARAVAPPVSEVSASHTQKNAIQRGEKKGDVDAMFSQEDASCECNEPTAHSMTETVEINKDKLHLSEAFWRGIPIPEGSLMYTLKIRLKEEPSDVRALEALLQAVLEQHDMLRALTVVETLLELQPNNSEWKFLKARTHEFLGEVVMAKQEYEELLSFHPLSARFLQGLAKLWNKVGEPTQALELIKSALDQAISEGKNVEARNLEILLSQFYIQLGNFEDALQRLNNMIEEDPDDFRPYLCQGLAYALMKQMDKARQSFDKYMQLCPADAFDQNHLDSLLLRAQTNKRVDAMKNMAMKSTSRNKKTKKAKPMKQPSIFGNPNLPDEGNAD